MKLSSEQEKIVQTSSSVTVDLAATLTVAGTLCIHSGAQSIDAGVGLFVGAIATSELARDYARLSSTTGQGDMYDLSYLQPPVITPWQTETGFESSVLEFVRHLLALHVAVRDFHLALLRSQTMQQTLQAGPDAGDVAVYQDAQLFYALHMQTAWSKLAECKHLETELLLSAPYLNILWHQFRLQLSAQSVFNYQELEATLRDIWQTLARDVARYKLNTFGISGFEALLQILQQKGQFADVIILLDDRWHKSTRQLTQLFEQSLHDL